MPFSYGENRRGSSVAYTKIFAIRKRLDRTVAYATNEKKTRLDGTEEYTVELKKD